MELKLNITVGQTITVILLMCIAFAGGFLLNQPTEQQVQEYAGFTDKDMNTLGQLAYTTGHCERLGLQSNIIIDDINGTPYGIPVCTKRNIGE